MDTKPKVLLLSTGDATRSLMAEGFLKALTGEHFHTVSTSIKSGEPHPLAIEAMSEVGIDISGQKSRSVADSLKEHFTYAVILYDAAKEHSPIFPFAPKLYHWSVADPVAANGSRIGAREIFQHTRNEIRTNVEKFLEEAGIKWQEALPVAA